MHVALAPGESLLPGAHEALVERFARPEVAAVLLPLVPRGDERLARAARRYLASWDARFLHPQNFYAPATRVATRIRIAGHRNADAAPLLADALSDGRRIEALGTAGVGVSTGIAKDLGAWAAHFRAEGAAWRELAAREPRFAGFAPAPWTRHNLLQAGRRTIEVLQACKRPDPLAWALHLVRESAFCAGAPSAEG